MKIVLLCNAGLAITHQGKTLLVDAPNGEFLPFNTLSDELWQKLQAEYEICGLYFSHKHPDHYDDQRVRTFSEKRPEIKVFRPEENPASGCVNMGPFEIHYQRIDHAPMEEETPPHVVSWIQVGGYGIYIAGDAKLDVDAHKAFLDSRKANIAFWNSMYLSQPHTRRLLHDVAEKNFIYHMPAEKPDGFGLWNKCQRNFQRYGDELKNITVLDRYPAVIE